MSACTLDTRKLHEAETGSAGTSAGGSGSVGPTAHGGSKVPSPLDLPVCSYSDGVQPGCDTLVPDAGFSRGIEGWQAEPLAITVDWDDQDADGSSSSGSIVVTNAMHGTNDGLASAGGMQCLPAAPGQIFDMAGDVFVPDGQGDGLDGGPYVGKAGLSILFWPSANCSDTSPTTGNAATNLVEDAGSWKHVEGAALAPDNTAAMSMRVLTIKPFRQFTFKALFDNVLLQKR